MSWGKGETDGALRAARAVATRLRGPVEGSGGGGGSTAAPVVAVAEDGREREEQRILSEVNGVVEVLEGIACLE